MFTDEQVKQFVDFCKENFEFNSLNVQNSYGSLPMCILDDVFSLQANYEAIVGRVTEWYARDFLNGEKYIVGHTLSQFMNNVDSESTKQIFTERHLGRFNKSCGRLKIELCYELARKLRCLGIETLEDFKNFPEENLDIIEILIRSVKGLNDQAVNYLFMLAGDPNRVKVDTHINKSVKAVFGMVYNNSDTQELFTKATQILRSDYPTITVARLDNIIWNYYHNK